MVWRGSWGPLQLPGWGVGVGLGFWGGLRGSNHRGHTVGGGAAKEEHHSGQQGQHPHRRAVKGTACRRCGAGKGANGAAALAVVTGGTSGTPPNVEGLTHTHTLVNLRVLIYMS